MSATEQFPNLKSPIFDTIRITPRLSAKLMGDTMCQTDDMDPDVVRKQQYRGPVGNRDVEAMRVKIAARMVASGLLIADILSWFDGFSAETIYRWARSAKNREDA